MTQPDWIEILKSALPADRAIAHMTDPGAGGIDVFLGTTRAEKSSDGRELIALDYEAYEQMAVEQMTVLAKRAREKWPIVRLALLHRVGRVAVGDPSVVIAVSTPHRADAFAACKFLIDQLKLEVAIWKKEIWADGSASWVHPESPSPGGRGAG
ncbi:MAG TPA: molybdenum cofactor biosynthesis protein MoaE [Tepidisphaeraceae bacterium]|jgi:molybdopterin synthase catalytic subunit